MCRGPVEVVGDEEAVERAVGVAEVRRHARQTSCCTVIVDW